MEFCLELSKVDLRFVMPSDWKIVLDHNKNFQKLNLYNGIVILSCESGQAKYDGLASILTIPQTPAPIVFRDISPAAARQIEKAIKEYMVVYNHLSSNNASAIGSKTQLITDRASCRKEKPVYSIKTCKGDTNSNILVAIIHESVFYSEGRLRTDCGFTVICRRPGSLLLIYSAEKDTGINRESNGYQPVAISFNASTGDYLVGISNEIGDECEKKLTLSLVQYCERA